LPSKTLPVGKYLTFPHDLNIIDIQYLLELDAINTVDDFNQEVGTII
jgi:hypothetical protein